MIIDVHTHINNYHEEKVTSLEACLSNLLEIWRLTVLIIPWYFPLTR